MERFVRYPPEVIGAAIRNAGRHALSRWRIVPLYVLKLCQQYPLLPRIYLAAFALVLALLVVNNVSRHERVGVPARTVPEAKPAQPL
jgi:hypothetical protein